MRQAHRDHEAAALEARAEALHANATRSHETDAAGGMGASPAESDPTPPRAGTSETPAPAEE